MGLVASSGAQTAPKAEPVELPGESSLPAAAEGPSTVPETLIPGPAMPAEPGAETASPPQNPAQFEPPPGHDGLPLDTTQPVKVGILAPRPREIVQTGAVDVFFDVENYALAEKGNRLHVIIDNESPITHADKVSPLVLRGLSEGGHTIRAFAVDPQGFALRNQEKAFSMVHFYNQRKDFQNFVSPVEPFLVVNHPPEGKVETDDYGRVCFDYWVGNLNPAQKGQFKVQYLLDNYKGVVADRGPVFWSNLPAGKHRLVVELVDARSQPAFGAFNRVERSFEVIKVLKASPAAAEELDPQMMIEDLPAPVPGVAHP
jgi:hypothetical protein